MNYAKETGVTWDDNIGTINRRLSCCLQRESSTYVPPGATTTLSSQTIHCSTVMPCTFGIVRACAGMRGMAVFILPSSAERHRVQWHNVLIC